MSFMQLQIYRKGALYSCECAKCSTTMYTHEWVYDDHNDRRDAMESGARVCDECGIGRADPETFHKEKDSYAGRYSAPGYLDCTDWHYSPNKRTLARELRDFYGDD